MSFYALTMISVRIIKLNSEVQEVRIPFKLSREVFDYHFVTIKNRKAMRL